MMIAIIGGGAAGLMAAATILESSSSDRVIVIEKNDGLGKKVIISGGGRCNVTTGITDIRTVLSKYPRGGAFLNSAIRQFPPSSVMEWFESHGVPLKIEDDLRVFPISNDGHDIVGVFEHLFRSKQVEVRLNTQVTAIQRIENQFQIHFKHSDPILVNKVILTTGGQAYRHTGSTGDGYAFAMNLGHTITPLAASLNAFFTREAWPAQISGLSFERAQIRSDHAEYTGPFLFTHKGMSGPAVFALSSLVAFETYGAQHPLNIWINLFPDETEEQLLQRLDAIITEHPKKSFANVLAMFIPRSLMEITLRQTLIDPECRAIETSKSDRKTTIHWLTHILLHVIARGAGDEFVTAGGINLKEVNPSTMESKISPGLFFAGEILDIDGFTGGFNLQASWATGKLAGCHATK